MDAKAAFFFSGVLFLCWFSSPVAAQDLQLEDKNQFCRKWVESTDGKCPKPPTVDSVNVTAYQGRWFEIGTSAEFKFLSEIGLICNTANYTINGTKPEGQIQIEVLNRGLNKAPFPLQFSTLTIGFNSRDVASRARAICQRVVTGSEITKALQRALLTSANLELETGLKVSSSLLRLLASLRLISPLSQQIYDDVAAIGTATSAWMTYSSSSQLLTSAIIRSRADKIVTETDEIADVSKEVSKRVEEIRKEVEGKGEVGEELKKDLAVVEKVAGFNGQVASLALRVSRFAEKLKKNVTSAPLPAVSVPTAFTGLARANLKEAGKLSVQIGNFGGPAPYWIIGLYGNPYKNYDEAIVYSCTDSPQRGRQLTLYLLSRTRTVPKSSLDRFFSVAKKYGISVGPSNQFLTTVQDPERCQKYQSELR